MEDTQKYILAEADYIAGMKYKDIADKYGVTVNTVKSWKTRYGWSRDAKSVHTKTKKVCTQKQKVADEVEHVMCNTELDDKKRLFCLYFVKSFNATKAYQKAYGCSYETAAAISYRLLENAGVKSEIHRLKQVKLNQAFLSEEDIFQKYMDIAFSDITDYVEFGRDTVPIMGPFGPISIEDEESGEKVELKKEINTVRLREHTDVDGTLITEVKQGREGVSIKLADRMKALEWIANHMDLATAEQRAKIAQLKANTDRLRQDAAGDDDRKVVIINDV